MAASALPARPAEARNARLGTFVRSIVISHATSEEAAGSPTSDPTNS